MKPPYTSVEDQFSAFVKKWREDTGWESNRDNDAKLLSLFTAAKKLGKLLDEPGESSALDPRLLKALHTEGYVTRYELAEYVDMAGPGWWVEEVFEKLDG